MTAAKVQDDKSLVVTFETADTATREVKRLMGRKDAINHTYHDHKDRQIMFVGCADVIDQLALVYKSHDNVCSVHVDWYLG